jgi:hypothetical protein
VNITGEPLKIMPADVAKSLSLHSFHFTILVSAPQALTISAMRGVLLLPKFTIATDFTDVRRLIRTNLQKYNLCISVESVAKKET